MIANLTICTVILRVYLIQLYDVDTVKFRTRMLIHCIELLYIVKGQWAPGWACVPLLASDS